MEYKVAMASLGCPKNLVDTENMLGILEKRGFTVVSEPEVADVIIVNTCAFISDAKEESITTILKMAEYKQYAKCRVLIVTGCLAQRYHEDIKKQLPEVDAIVGTGDFDKIDDVVLEALASKYPVYCSGDGANIPDDLPRMRTTPPHSAYLKISEGCNNFCTYCIIPSIRGKYHSRTMKSIVEEAKQLAGEGVRELILIAQDTTCYGMDLYGEYRLPELLRELCKIDGIEWIRVHYCYPELFSDELIDVFCENKKICRYFDIPVQHASDEVLRRMGRKTTKAQIVSLISKIREKMPDAVIRTSVIVGFPGETKEQFEELCDFVREIKFDRLGVFAYSKEEGTAAAKLKGQVSAKMKERRRDTLMRIAQKISLEHNEAKKGTVVEVMCEGYERESYMYYGRTRGDSIDIDSLVYFAADREVENGEIVFVKILNVDEYDIIGEMMG